MLQVLEQGECMDRRCRSQCNHRMGMIIVSVMNTTRTQIMRVESACTHWYCRRCCRYNIIVVEWRERSHWIRCMNPLIIWMR